MLWNGTDITDLISKCDVYGAKFNKLNYWVIQYTDVETNKKYEEVCIVRSATNSLPCLIDELKSVFGLPKIGTHWCRLSGKIYILIRPTKTPEGLVKEETTLNMYNHGDGLMKMQIQEIFAFRELLGVTCSFESSIIIREGKSGPYPISFYEPNMKPTDGSKIIPATVLDKWFDDTSIDNVVKKLCKINTIDNLTMILHTLRNNINDVIERVDRRLITYGSLIVERITLRLQTSLG